MIIMIMGVSGSGKTTIGQMLASSLGWQFRDADSFHSAANIQKMSAGIPLEDTDRMPWLLAIQDAIALWLAEDKNVVLACSALKASYREMLLVEPTQIKVVYIQGSFELLSERLRSRRDHFMTEILLQSQLETLELPHQESTLYVDAIQPPEMIVEQIRKGLGL